MGALRGPGPLAVGRVLSFTLKRDGFAEAPRDADVAPSFAMLSCLGLTVRKKR